MPPNHNVMGTIEILYDDDDVDDDDPIKPGVAVGTWSSKTGSERSILFKRK